MGTFNKMSKEDKERLQQSGFISKDKPKKKATSWKLVYNKKEVLQVGPYSLCQWKKNQVKKESQYSVKLLKIVPNE